MLSVTLASMLLPLTSPASAAKAATVAASAVDYAQCANGAPPGTSLLCPGGWIQGILQGNNSHYSEDEVTPQRAEVKVPKGSSATGRNLVFRYQTRKGSADAHAYDSLATWNYTQTGLNASTSSNDPASRCYQLNATCPGGPASTIGIPDDPVAVLPSGAGVSPVTAAHMIPAGPERVLTMFGGTLTNSFYGNTVLGLPAHDNPTGPGDDYATITVEYRVADANSDGKADTDTFVQLLFGGHLAPTGGPRGWGISQGTPLGSSNINGGPYHIKWAAADNESIGNRDNQIQGAAILAPPEIAVSKTADAPVVSSGSPIGFTITVSSTGTSAATSVTLSDPLPGGTGIDWSISPAYSGPGTCSITGSPPSETLSCSFGDLAPGASASVHVTSATTAGTSGTFNNTATASSTNAPPASASASTIVKPPNLVVTKTADDTTVSSGDSIGFTVTVSNTGTGTAMNVTLSDPLPGGTGIDWSISPAYAGPGTCSISGTPPSQTLSCSFGNLTPGTGASVHVTSATTAGTSGTFNNTATAQADNNPPTTGSASVTVNAPNLQVVKVADVITVSSGDTIGFTITVSNAGTGTAVNATLSDPLPGGAGIDWSISPAYAGPGTCSITGDPPSETLSCSFGNLVPGASASVHVTSATTAGTSGTFENTATAQADNNPPTTGSSSVTVNPPNLLIAKVADNPVVSSGDSIGFSISVSNTGTGTAKNVTLSDPLPGGTGIDWSISPAYAGPGTCSISGGPPSETLSCSFGNLVPGASASVHVTSATTADTSGTFENTATAQADNNPPVMATASVAVNQPNLVVTKVADNAVVSSGSPIGFTVTVSNTGTGTAKNVTLSDPLPGGTGIDWSISPAYAGPGTCSISGGPPSETLSCSFGDLAPGASASVHVSSATTADTSGTFENTATAQADNNPPTTGSASTTVKPPNLVVTKTADDTTVSSGDSIGFTVTVSNTGTGTAMNVTLSDPLPGGTGIDWSISPAYAGPGTCSISGTPPSQTLSCSFGNLTPGTGASVHVTSATTGDTSGTFDNTATVQADNNPPVSSTASVTVLPPNLTITKTADDAAVNANSPIGFTITVSNSGPGTARNVTLSDPLPGGAGIDWSISPAYAGPGTCSISGDPPSETLSCSFGDLAPNASASVHVSSGTTSATEGEFENTATTQADNHPPRSATATVTVNRANLNVTKLACPGTAVPGGVLTYTIEFSNTGTAPATSTQLTDTIPDGTTVADAGGGTVAPDGKSVTWNLGTLAVGASGTRTLSINVPAAADGTNLVNKVELSSPDAPTATTEITTPASKGTADASGRAYGVEASLLGGAVKVDPTPDTNTTNPGQVATIDDPTGSVHADLVRVVNSTSITGSGTSDEAIATTSGVRIRIDIPGTPANPDIAVDASSVVARSESHAGPTTAGSSRDGSKVQDLVINGTTYGDVTDSKTIPVNDPTTGARIGEVRILEVEGSGAAAVPPVVQPESDVFRSGLKINAIHVIVADLTALELTDESSDAIVAHAESKASFPSGLPCGQGIPQVRGDAFILDTPNVEPPAGSVKIGLVTLPITGGTVDSSVADLAPLGTGTGTAHTDGALSPLAAHSSAVVNGLNLLGGTITATTIKATSDTTSGTSSGSATIEDLVIAGTNVCETLLGAPPNTCKPDPNTVLVLDDANVIVLLNEQIAGPGELRVNAIHIFVIGRDNPFGLPVGAEIVISSAFSGTTS